MKEKIDSSAVAEKEDATLPDVKGEQAQDSQVKDEDFLPKTADEGEEGDSSSALEDAASEKDDGDETQDKDTEEKEPAEIEGLDEELSLDDLDLDGKEQDKKSGVQKRIDKLVAEKKALEERLDKIEQRSTSKTPEYTEEQLKRAMEKAMSEGDSSLMWEIIDYRVRKEKESALAEERKRSEEASKAQQRTAQEWFSVVEEYEHFADNSEPELFKGSHRDLNIKDSKSLLMQVATKLYQDPNRAERYRKEGGQRLAISDAIRFIIRKKNASVSSKETDQLKRKLAKEKRKSSVSSGSAVKKESPVIRSRGSALDDYLSERRNELAKMRGGL
jgi:hypothetical protein